MCWVVGGKLLCLGLGSIFILGVYLGGCRLMVCVGRLVGEVMGRWLLLWSVWFLNLLKLVFRLVLCDFSMLGMFRLLEM